MMDRECSLDRVVLIIESEQDGWLCQLEPFMELGIHYYGSRAEQSRSRSQIPIYLQGSLVQFIGSLLHAVGLCAVCV